VKFQSGGTGKTKEGKNSKIGCKRRQNKRRKNIGLLGENRLGLYPPERAGGEARNVYRPGDTAANMPTRTPHEYYCRGGGGETSRMGEVILKKGGAWHPAAGGKKRQGGGKNSELTDARGIRGAHYSERRTSLTRTKGERSEKQEAAPAIFKGEPPYFERSPGRQKGIGRSDAEGTALTPQQGKGVSSGKKKRRKYEGRSTPLEKRRGAGNGGPWKKKLCGRSSAGGSKESRGTVQESGRSDHERGTIPAKRERKGPPKRKKTGGGF